ncbi:MAG: DoxX family protein [Candidatus Paceibacterota bacterium]
MGVVYLVGHIVFGGYFLMNAYNHLIKNKGTIGYAQFKGVKHAKMKVIVSGLLLLVGGVCFVGGFSYFWGSLALLVFMIPVTFKMHAFWKETDPQAKMNERVSFYKNMAIVGALLMML